MGWFQEELHGEVAQSIRVDEDIYAGRTEYQTLRFFRNDLLGRVMVLDGAVQVTELDEPIYSEMMVHVPVLSHPDPKRVLIVGGGDGTCLREAVRHENIREAVLAELDGGLIELCERHMPDMVQGAFRHEKARLAIGDAVDFIAKTEDRFDVIIVDSTDPAGPSEPLFTSEFYQGCKAVLARGGVLVAQAGCPMYQKDFGRQIGVDLAELFSYHGYYQAAVPSYLGGLHAFAWGSDAIDLKAVTPRPCDFETRYYSDNSRMASFLLPFPKV
ncbi:polyamine aminopropyltransferase [Aestuariispira insulae]|uniref:Polyamine aminopropyltransferase n=1 Tax=Aestuariispira insulae TaxID=1461337 RepID=A0A3D9H436_9PROT|nr:polyamine aminopropyltransferase [Aestuariispira insulae]RED44257.1 spermidine synthase [Aestuariispira insulae]